MKSAAAITRRSVLGASLLVAAACKHGSSPATPRIDPDASTLAAARSSEIELIGATTDSAEHALHLQHLTALGGSAPAVIATPLTEPIPLHSLLRSNAASLRNAAAAALNGAHAAVLASIAASHEVMVRD